MAWQAPEKMAKFGSEERDGVMPVWCVRMLRTWPNLGAILRDKRAWTCSIHGPGFGEMKL